MNGARVWRRGFGALCISVDACGLGAHVTGIDVVGLGGAFSGVVELRGVRPHRALVIDLTFA